MRLPDESAAKEYAPYIIHQFVTGSDEQQAGERVKSYALVRSIFSVYNKDSSEGSLMLLNLMERLRIAWLEQVVIAQQFQLDLSQKLEGLAYPDDIAPFFAGEMMSVWKMPAVERKVRF